MNERYSFCQAYPSIGVLISTGAFAIMVTFEPEKQACGIAPAFAGAMTLMFTYCYDENFFPADSKSHQEDNL